MTTEMIHRTPPSWVSPELRYAIDGECWLWAPRGFVKLNDPSHVGVLRDPGDGRTYQAHREVYAICALRGEVPRMPCTPAGRLLPSVRVWQTCRDRRCIRPEHLRAGTREEWLAWCRAHPTIARRRDPSVWRLSRGLLMPEQVARIRDPARTQTDAALAGEYGVSLSTIRACKYGRTYRK